MPEVTLSCSTMEFSDFSALVEYFRKSCPISVLESTRRIILRYDSALELVRKCPLKFPKNRTYELVLTGKMAFSMIPVSQTLVVNVSTIGGHSVVERIRHKLSKEYPTLKWDDQSKSFMIPEGDSTVVSKLIGNTFNIKKGVQEIHVKERPLDELVNSITSSFTPLQLS